MLFSGVFFVFIGICVYICTVNLKQAVMAADYIPSEQLKEVIAGLKGEKDYLMHMYFVTACSTALRFSDLSQLKWGDLFDSKWGVRGCIEIKEQKTKKVRKITLSSKIRGQISELRSHFFLCRHDKYIFSQGTSKKPISIQGMNKKLKVVKDKYKLSGNISTHSLRKSFARAMWEANNKSDYSLILLQDILNHSSIAITRRYLGIRDEEISSAYTSTTDKLF